MRHDEASGTRLPRSLLVACLQVNSLRITAPGGSNRRQGGRKLQSKNASYLAKVDHLRALAAVTVMLFHTKLSTLQAPTQDAIHLVLIDQGHVGVPLFMFISGFSLSQITTQKKIIVKRFCANRILRIYP